MEKVNDVQEEKIGAGFKSRISPCKHPTLNPHNQGQESSSAILSVQIIVGRVISEPCITRRGSLRGLAVALWELEVVPKPTGLL